MIYIGNGIYSDATPNEYLQHYGVIGMKWGVRRARQLGRSFVNANKRLAKNVHEKGPKAAKAVKDFMPKKGALKRRANRADKTKQKNAKVRYYYRIGKLSPRQANKQYWKNIGEFYRQTYGR